MPASYPAGFDTMSDPATNLSGPPLHSTMHNQINDVVEAIEAELGLNPSGADATVAASISLLRAAAVPGAWTAVLGGIGFTNGWVNFDAGHPAQYRKIGDEVELRGLIKTGTVGTGAFTLPAGFRPFQTDDTFPVASNGAYGQVTVFATGVVQIGNPASNVYAYLSGIRFSTVA